MDRIPDPARGADAEMSAAIACPKCQAPAPAGSRFCASCGSSLLAAAAALCSNCNTALSPGSRFCGSCGQPVA